MSKEEEKKKDNTAFSWANIKRKISGIHRSQRIIADESIHIGAKSEPNKITEY